MYTHKIYIYIYIYICRCTDVHMYRHMYICVYILVWLTKVLRSSVWRSWPRRVNRFRESQLY